MAIRNFLQTRRAFSIVKKPIFYKQDGPLVLMVELALWIIRLDVFSGFLEVWLFSLDTFSAIVYFVDAQIK